MNCRKCSRPIPASVVLCDDCVDTFTKLLWTVPGLVHDLTITRSRLDVFGTGRNGGKSAETPLYIRLTGKTATDKDLERDTYRKPWVHKPTDDQIPSAGPHRDLEEAIVHWGLQLEMRFRDEIPHRAPGLRTIALHSRTASASAIRHPERLAIAPLTASEVISIWMANNPQYLRQLDQALDMITDITHAIEQARTAVDRPAELRYIGPCPDCSNDLFAEVDSDSQWVRCRRCRDQFEVTKVIREAVRKAEDNLFTIARIARYLDVMERPVPRQTLHTWHYRGRIRSRGWLHTDRDTGRASILPVRREDRDPPVFRFGDVLRLVEREKGAGA